MIQCSPIFGVLWWSIWVEVEHIFGFPFHLLFQVKEVFSAIAPAVGLSVGLAVGQSSIADEISELIKRPKFEAGFCYDPENVSTELHSAVDILVATPGRLMDHINNTKGFTLEHLCYLVSCRCCWGSIQCIMSTDEFHSHISLFTHLCMCVCVCDLNNN